MTAGIPLKFAAALVASFALQAVAAHAGTVRICNDTSGTIQISIGYSEPGSAFTTRGWWSAGAGQCTGHIARGSKGKYYVHIARAGGEPITIRTGDKGASLCTSAGKFEDRFRDHLKDDRLDCAAAGLVTQKFQKMEMQPEGQEILTLQSDGTLKISAPSTPQPQPQPPAAVPPPNERIVAPQPNKQIAAPLPQATQTPEACRRFPNLC